MTKKDKPEEGKQYLLIGGTNKPSIANGNSWEESEIKLKEKTMVNEPSNEELEQVEEVSLEDWNDACDLWDLMHDEHGLQGF